MKKLSITYLLLALSLLSGIGGNIAYAAEYISEIAVASSGSRENAVKQLTDYGYKILDKDLNAGAAGDWIFLGYKTTTNYKDAITNLIVSEGSGATGDITIDGKNYQMVNCLNGFSGDLNKGSGGKFLYLKYTKDKGEAEPALSGLSVSGNVTQGYLYVPCYNNTVMTNYSVNLNWQAGGDYIYLIMEKKAYNGQSASFMDHFSVEYLGSGYYKFVVPVVVRDASNVLNSISGEIKIRQDYYDCDIKLQCKDYYDETTFKGDNDSIPLFAYHSSSLIDHWSFKKLPSNEAYCYIEDGDHKNVRLTSFIWRSESFLIKPSEPFIISGNIAVNSTTKTPFTVNIVSSRPKASDLMDAPMLVDPYLNMESSEPGWVKAMFISTNNMLNFGLIDVTSGKTYAYELESSNNFELDMQAYDTEHEYVAVSVIKKTVYQTDGSQDYGYHLSTVPFSVKPLHQLHSDGEFSTNSSYDYVPYDVDPAAPEGELEGHKWVRFWKGGPRFMLSSVTDPLSTTFYEGSNTKDPAYNIYSKKWRSVTKAELLELISRTKSISTIDQFGNIYYRYQGKDEYSKNEIVFTGYEYYTAADPDKSFPDWEIMSFERRNGPQDPQFFHHGLSSQSIHVVAVVNDNVACDYLFAPTLSWKVTRPHDNDIVEDDTYIVERSYDIDFYESDAIGSVLTTDTLRSNDEKFAHYAFTDDSEERYNPNPESNSLPIFKNWKNISESAKNKLTALKYDARYTYYRVSRAVVRSLWPYDTDYFLSWRVLNTNILPVINNVDLQLGRSWESDRSVKVTVSLNNPYLWELVDAADSAAVHQEAKRQGFDRRLYTWNPDVKIKVVRYSPEEEHYNGKDEAEKTFIINGRELKFDEKAGKYIYTLEDVLSAPVTHYMYKAVLDTTDIHWAMGGVNEYISSQRTDSTVFNDLTPVTNLVATRGTLQGQVSLSWDPVDDTNRTFTIKSRKYGTDEWTVLATIADCFYNDKQAPAGQVNEYQVTAHTVYRGKTYDSEPVVVIGYNSYYGTISGKLKLYNGYAMPGDNLYVRIQRQDSLDIRTVYVVGTDSVIMPGLSELSFDKLIKVNPDGTYICDSVPYLSVGNKQYTVNVDGLNGVDFENAAGTIAPITLDMNSDTFSHNAIDFTCKDVLTFTGDVLYAGSTIPVSGASFQVNGVVMCDANGRALVSDERGHFSLMVHKNMPIALQIFKKGHTFDNDYLVGNDSTRVIPIEGFAEKKVYDKTTVRLVGRVVGGDVQGKLPLGMAMSHNNLGDNMRMELQLEGDNTSNIVYEILNPEKETRDTTYVQEVKIGDKLEACNSTHVVFQRKRIHLYPDSLTGEFCVDLYPVKYKVTSLSAKGYSTLTNEGEGFEILDLTNCSDTLHVDNQDYLDYLKEQGIKGDRTLRSTAYQATYQRVYHVPATVTLEQYNTNGVTKNKVLGERTVKFKNLQGIENELTTAETVGDSVVYSFGYPVFRDLRKYRFHASAHEDFYYNNKKDKAPEVVLLEGGHLIVYNGLESAKSKIEAELDEKGQADFVLNVDNPCFNLLDTAALRSINAEVEVHGYYYKAAPIRGFILGEENAGTEVMTLDEDIEVIDVLRDPYGTHSYAWRDKGTEYHWDKENKTVTARATQIVGSFGASKTLYIGIGVAEKNSISGTIGFNISIPISKTCEGKFGEYTMTLNERISTSDDPLMQGAMADVYIGRVDVSHLRETNAFSVIDSTSYRYLQNAISSGAVKVVKEGKDAQGTPSWLVIGKKLVIAKDSIASTFAFSQKHILGTIIPQLEKRYSELVLDCTKEQAESLARTTGVVRYYKDEEGNPAMAIPTNDYTGMNEALKIQNTINQWRNHISMNEEVKRQVFSSMGTALKHYSVSDQPVEFSENVGAYYDDYKYDVKGGPTSFNISIGGGGKNNGRDGLIQRDTIKAYNDKPNDSNEFANTYNDKKHEASVWGASFSINVSPCAVSPSVSATQHCYIKDLRNTGFKLDLEDNSYMDIDVYKREGYLLMDKKEFDYVSSKMETYQDFKDFDKTTVETGEYVFIYRGGAMRSPWFDADSSYVFTESGKLVPLGERPKKIDNPKIYIANPVASNIRRDDKALYSVRLTNETEFNGDPASLKPIPLTLRLADNCNPLGAKITMDGAPITDGRKFQLKPGETLTKTIEVARGDGYDFNDLGLVFHDQTLTLVDSAKFSVHFTPESSPVTLTLPKDQWVMNTLSDRDKETGKYYLPVEITGFDTNYDEFDHIELQYKKQTEGESQWVNLCSFYNRQDLYDKASGVKQLINSNTISGYAFYGEKDTIEMRYDLRAVTFCRLGTGFITKSSNISSGIKDTRTPEVFGKPTPVNGILTFGDVISVPFNEPIAYNYLDRTANFSVRGFTNNSDANHSARLRFGDLRDYAETKVKRSLKGTDFTLEMNVQVDKGNKGAMFFSMQEGTDESLDRLCFLYYTEGNQLLAFVDGKVYGSKPLSEYQLNIHDAMTHVGLMYCAQDELPQFIVGNKAVPANYIEPLDANIAGKTGKITSEITLGAMKGYMSDVRLWQRELNSYEISNLYRKKLNGSEGDLLAWWPMDEAMGNVVADHANGADLNLYGVTWETPKGYSAKLYGQPLEISKSVLFNTEARQDFTLGFWFKADSLATAQLQPEDNDMVMLFCAGSNELRDKGEGKMRIGFVNDQLMLRAEGDTIDFGMNNNFVQTGQWHYLTLVTNNLQNIASLFIDGQMVAETSADKIGRIAGSDVKFGSKGFFGYIDEISMWHIALPQSYINDIKTTALTGKEKELNVYMSFESDELQGDNLMKTVFSARNQKVSETTGKIVGDVMFDASTVGQEEAVHAPMKKDIGITNINFTWTCTDNDLQINLQCKDAEINNQRLDLVLRGVEDLQGNPMTNPLMWSVYVNKNVLTWKDKTLKVNVEYGEGTTIEAPWQNISGRVLNYTVETSSHWLKLDRSMGIANPLEESDITMKISNGMAPGEYSAIVNLIDEDGLVSKLYLEVAVEAQDPDWDVTTSKKFAESMFVTAQVLVDGADSKVVDTDERDVVAAFFNGICLGKSNIQKKDDNSAYVYLNVRGNKDVHDNKLIFYLWDKSEGQIKRLKQANNKDITFTPDRILGSHTEPVTFVYDTISIQSIDLKKGWNWVSFNVKPFANKDLNTLFLDNTKFTTDDVFKGSLKNNLSSYFYGEDVNKWGNKAPEMTFELGYVYQMYIQNPCIVQVEGYEINDNVRKLTFEKNGWNELPYLLKSPHSVRIAMSDYVIGDKALPGTIIKSHNEFAVADANGTWYGSLEYMRPGEGYFVNHIGETCEVAFVNTSSVEDTESDDYAFATTRTATSDSKHNEYAGAMPVIAIFSVDDDVQEEDVLVAYHEDVEVGRAAASTLICHTEDADRYVYFLMVNAGDKQGIRFAKERDGEIVEITPRAIKFDSNAVVGTLNRPFVIDFSPFNNKEIFDIEGRHHTEEEELLNQRVYIINGEKQMTK